MAIVTHQALWPPLKRVGLGRSLIAALGAGGAIIADSQITIPAAGGAFTRRLGRGRGSVGGGRGSASKLPQAPQLRTLHLEVCKMGLARSADFPKAMAKKGSLKRKGAKAPAKRKAH